MNKIEGENARINNLVRRSVSAIVLERILQVHYVEVNIRQGVRFGRGIPPQVANVDVRHLLKSTLLCSDVFAWNPEEEWALDLIRRMEKGISTTLFTRNKERGALHQMEMLFRKLFFPECQLEMLVAKENAHDSQPEIQKMLFTRHLSSRMVSIADYVDGNLQVCSSPDFNLDEAALVSFVHKKKFAREN